MAKFVLLFLVAPMLLTSAAPSFSFFGFGSKPSEDHLEASASSDSVTQQHFGTRFIPTSLTNILFGTGTSGSSTESGSGLLGTSTPTPGLLSVSAPPYPGPSGLPTSVQYGGQPAPAAPVPTSFAYGQPASAAYGGQPPSGGRPYNGAPSGYGRPAVPAPNQPYGNSYNNAQTQTQAQGQNNGYSTAPLPQPNSNGMSVYNSALPSNPSANSPGMPMVNSGNAQSNLGSSSPQGTTLYQNQPNMGQGQASYSIQTSNGIRFNEDTNTAANQQGSSNSGTTKKGSFSWVSPEGQKFEVNYVAEAQGFKPQGTHLPTPPPSPAASRPATQNQYGQNYGQSQSPATQYSAPAPAPAVHSPPSTSYGSSSGPTYSYTPFMPSQPVPTRPY